MRLWDTMLGGRIAWLALLRPDCALTSNAAFKLLLDFGSLSLFEWIGATAREQRCGNREEDRQALHLLILESESPNASVVAALAAASAGDVE